MSGVTIGDCTLDASSIKVTGPSNIKEGGPFKVIARGISQRNAASALGNATFEGTTVSFVDSQNDEGNYDLDVTFERNTYKDVSKYDGDSLLVLRGFVQGIYARPRS